MHCCTGLLRHSANIGMIINILLIKSVEPYFVSEVLDTEKFSSHFHSFIVQRTKLHFVSQVTCLITTQ